MTTHSVPAAQSEPRAIGHQSRGVASNIQVRHLAFAVRLLFFTLAAVAIRRELAGVRHTDLLAGFQSYGAFQVAAALGFTAASFLALGSLELLTLRHYGGERSHAVRGPTALATAYVAHAFSQSAGFAILTGAAIRLRAYIRHGMDSVSVARLSAFITMIMTLGLLTLAGIAMLAASTMSVPRPAMRAGLAGTLFILPPLGYVAWSMFGRSSGIGRGAWRVPRPSPPLAAGQIVLSALDWLFAGLVLFLLLPSPLFRSLSVVPRRLHARAGCGIREPDTRRHRGLRCHAARPAVAAHGSQ